MWKVVFRGIRETLERRVCRTNVYSQSSQDNAKNEVKTSLTCQQKFLPPVFITCDKGFCGSAKSTGAKNNRRDSNWNTKHSWTEAVGWSSVLAAGWVVCQTLCLRNRIFDRDSAETLKSKLHDYSGISFILMQLLNLHPRKILPVTNCVGTSKKISNQDSNSQWTAEKPFGPITIEEVRMLFCRHTFMFNLGLCYELGIGTLADQAKAAKYYNDAATHDHADALYNLGVFHAQGRGGLPIDIGTARTYFTRAAKLGQVQAQHALDLEKAETQSKKNISTLSNINLKNSESLDSKKYEENNAHVKLSDLMLLKNVGDTFGIITKSNEVFLDFLGLKKPNQAPIMITTSDCRVPY
ncbi:SKT5 protein, partial [Acromyrmex heyeri]